MIRKVHEEIERVYLLLSSFWDSKRAVLSYLLNFVRSCRVVDVVVGTVFLLDFRIKYYKGGSQSKGKSFLFPVWTQLESDGVTMGPIIQP